MSKYQDKAPQHLQTLELLLTRAGDQIIEANHFKAMNTLWAIIPRLYTNEREHFEEYRKKIIAWRNLLDNIKGSNYPQERMRRERVIKQTIVPEVEALYWDLCSAVMNAKYFDGNRNYGPTWDELDFSDAEPA